MRIEPVLWIFAGVALGWLLQTCNQTIVGV